MSISDLSEHNTHTTQRGIANKPVSECKASEARNWLAGPTENMRKDPPRPAHGSYQKKVKHSPGLAKLAVTHFYTHLGNLLISFPISRTTLETSSISHSTWNFIVSVLSLELLGKPQSVDISAGNLKAVFSRMEGVLKTKNVFGHS